MNIFSAINLAVIFATGAQVVAAVMALRLIRGTRHRLGWTLVSVGLGLVALRRVTVLTMTILAGQATADSWPSTIFMILSSLSLIIGIAVIGRVLRRMGQTEIELRSSETSLRALIQQSSDAIFVSSHDGTFVDVNEQAIRMLGYKRDDLLGRHLRDVIDKDDQVANPFRFEELWAGKVVQIRRKLIRADGSRIVAEVSAGMLTDGRLLSNVRDVTERWRAEQQIRLQAHLLDSVQQAVVALDANGTVTYCNAFTSRLYERPVDQIVGRYVTEAIPTDVSVETLEEIRQRLRAGQTWAGEVRAITPKGERVPVMLIQSPITKPNGQYAGSVGISFDISSLRNVEESLRNYQTRLEIVSGIATEVSAEMGMTELVDRSMDRIRAAYPQYRVSMISIEDARVRLTASSAPDGCQPTADLPLDLDELATYRQMLESKGRVAIADLSDESCLSPVAHRIVAEFGTRALLHASLVRGGRMIGILSVTSPHPHAWSDYEVATLTEVAQYLAVILSEAEEREQRTRVEESLRQADERFRLALADSQTTVFTQDRLLRYTWVYNPKMGGTSDSLLGRTDRDWLQDPSVESLERLKRRVLETGKSAREEVRLRYGDQDFYYDTKVQPMADRTGEAQGVICCSTDVTDLRRQALALAQSEQRYRSLLDVCPDGILIHDGSNVLYANPAFLRILGYADPAELVGVRVIDLVHADYREVVAKRVAAMVSASGPAPLLQEKLLRKNGGGVDVDVTAVPCVWDGRRAVQVVVRDISERIASEAEQRRLNEQLLQAQKLEIIGTLAAGIAHDFNNLLAPVIAYTELVESELVKDHPAHKPLTEVLRAAHRAKDLATRILSFSRQPNGDRQAIRLEELIHEVTELLRSSLPKGVSIGCEISSVAGPLVGDATQLHQVLMNLCLNAAQAMPQGGHITVGLAACREDRCPHCGTRLRGPHTHLFVADTGCGMDEATLSRIFDPFFTTKGAGKGTGLGLAVTQGIVARHNGHLCVESAPRVGSTFHLCLPSVGVETDKADVFAPISQQ